MKVEARGARRAYGLTLASQTSSRAVYAQFLGTVVKLVRKRAACRAVDCVIRQLKRDVVWPALLALVTVGPSAQSACLVARQAVL